MERWLALLVGGGMGTVGRYLPAGVVYQLSVVFGFITFYYGIILAKLI